MSHLSIVEAFSCCDAFLQTLLGGDVYRKWKQLKARMKFDSEKEFANWMIEHCSSTSSSLVPGDTSKVEPVVGGDKNVTKSVAVKAEVREDDMQLLESFEAEEFRETFGVGGGGSVGLVSDDKAVVDLDEVGAVGSLCEDDDEDIRDEPDMEYYLEDESHSNGLEEEGEEGNMIDYDEGNDDHQLLRQASLGLGTNGKADDSGILASPGTLTSTKSFKCHLCSAEFGQRHNLVRHKIGVHLHSRQGAHTCSRCPAIFNSRTDRLNHERAEHAEQSYPHPCYLCDRRFSQRDNLKRHMVSVHQQLKQFRCSFCPQTFSQPYQRKRHEERVHLKIKKFSCSKCKVKFADRVELGMHLVKRHGENVSST